MKINIVSLKPSELIRVALADLEAVEKDPVYIVDMRIWHGNYKGVSGDYCAVCLGGAVMAKSLGADPYNNLVPDDFEEEIAFRLAALDSFRQGLINKALWYMSVEPAADVSPHMTVVPYEDNPARFKADMQAMATHLEEHGL